MHWTIHKQIVTSEALSHLQKTPPDQAAINTLVRLLDAGVELTQLKPFLPSETLAVLNLLQPLDAAQRQVLAKAPERLTALASRLQSPELEALRPDFLALIQSTQSDSEIGSQQIIVGLQLLVKTKPDSEILVQLLPKDLQPLANTVLKQEDSYLSQTLLNNPDKLERLGQRISDLINNTFDENDLIAGIELLALSQQEFTAISELLPHTGSVRKLLSTLRTKTDFLNKTGLSDPAKREKIIQQFELLGSIEEGQIPNREQLLAIAELAKILGSELNTFKAFLPASAQKAVSVLIKTLSSYESLNPASLGCVDS